MSAAVGYRTTFGREFRGSEHFKTPRIFPCYADLVTRLDDRWKYKTVKVIGGNARRFLIRAIKPTVIPGLRSPLPANVTMIVPGYALQACHQRSVA